MGPGDVVTVPADASTPTAADAVVPGRHDCLCRLPSTVRRLAGWEGRRVDPRSSARMGRPPCRPADDEADPMVIPGLEPSTYL